MVSELRKALFRIYLLCSKTWQHLVMCHCVQFCIYSSEFICTKGEKRCRTVLYLIARKLLTLKNVYLVLTFLVELHDMVIN